MNESEFVYLERFHAEITELFCENLYFINENEAAGKS